MKKLLWLLLIAAAIVSSGFCQALTGKTLPHTTLPGGAKLRVSVPETVSEVTLESKAKGKLKWTTLAARFRNLPGGTEVSINVPPAVRQHDFRVKVRAVRPAPRTIRFEPGKAKSEMRLAAGLPAGTKLSAEFFDTKAKQWKRFATVEAPKDREKSWRIPVPPAYRAAQLRITRLESKTPGSQSSRFPAAFRTGKTNFPSRVATSGGNSTPEVGHMSPVYGSDSSGKSSSPQVEESDIWKIAGTKIYFFNQSRGLQVIETANAADPEIISFLRMPAVGEDMYALPGSRAVLVRRDWSAGGTTGVVLVDASQPQARILSELQVPGWYADSRMVDGHLLLATTQYDATSSQSSSTVRVIADLNTKPRIASQATLDFAITVMGVGSDYLWVSGNKDWSWNQSLIALFPLSDFPSLGAPLRTELGGIIYDKFKVHQNGNKLFAVAQSWSEDWQQSTALESYSLETKPQLLQRLPLVEGESLHATRFDGDRAYVVTFEQVDPLWIIDLSNPAAMRIESELQVPGWSTFIQPVGGYLAAVGVDAGKVTASLFDVRDPSKPSLSSRVDIGDKGYTWSEANWDEKAVAILPESGLILLPYSSFNADGDVSAVQLIDLDVKSGTLAKRGIINHAFTPRRANELREGILASISNRELFLLNASNRDKPSALAEVALAFGSDRILGSRNGLLVHAENGNWKSSGAVLRVSSSNDPDAVFAQASLGDGEVVSGALRGNQIVALLRSFRKEDEGRLVRFDATKLPLLVETGRCTFKLGSAWNTTVDLLWPAENLAVAAVRRGSAGWWRPVWAQGGATISGPMVKSISAADVASLPYYNPADEAAALHAFDVSGAIPRVLSSLDLKQVAPRNVSPFFAADGLVVFSSDQKDEQASPATKKPNNLESTYFQVVDYADPSAPYLWPEAELPGRLESIADFDRSAGLLFAANNDGGLEALLYEGGSAQSIAKLPKSDLRSIEGRTAWTFAAKRLSRHQLDSSGSWKLDGTRSDLPFSDPSALRAHAGGIIASRGDILVSVPQNLAAPLKRKTVPGWSWWLSSDLSRLHIGDTVLAIPVGEYGIEMLR